MSSAEEKKKKAWQVFSEWIKDLVSIETMVYFQWGSEPQKFGFIRWVESSYSDQGLVLSFLILSYVIFVLF